MKWVSSYPTNVGHGYPAVMGVMVLNEREDRPAAGNYGLPLDHGCQDGRRLQPWLPNTWLCGTQRWFGIVGAGVQGRYNLLALREVLPALKLVKYYDVYPDALRSTVEALQAGASYEVIARGSAREVIEGSDVVVTATGKLEQVVYQEAWVKPGALVLPVHHRGWENQTIHKSR